jgi:hypothetical protein
MNRFAAAPLTLLVLAFGLVACGGDDPPSKADFAASAEKICKDAEKELRGLEESSSRADVAKSIDKAVDATQTSVEELQDLELPEGAAGDQAKEFVDAIETEIDKGIPALEDLGEAIKTNDQKAAQDAYRRLQEIEDTNSDKLARELGIEGCAT